MQNCANYRQANLNPKEVRDENTRCEKRRGKLANIFFPPQPSLFHARLSHSNSRYLRNRILSQRPRSIPFSVYSTTTVTVLSTALKLNESYLSAPLSLTRRGREMLKTDTWMMVILTDLELRFLRSNRWVCAWVEVWGPEERHCIWCVWYVILCVVIAGESVLRVPYHIMCCVVSSNITGNTIGNTINKKCYFFDPSFKDISMFLIVFWKRGNAILKITCKRSNYITEQTKLIEHFSKR